MKIEIKNLTKSFGNNIALNNLNFTVEEGQIFGIIGPNGAGKTTTLKIIEGLLQPDKGEVLFDEVEISHKKKVRKLGVQLQDNTLLEYATVEETIDFFSSIYNFESHRNTELIEAFQMNDFMKKKTSSLSIGQQRNLCILLAFLHDPEVVILDEPSSGLDLRARLTLWDNIRHYVKGCNNTVIITTHLMEEVELLCQNIIFINKGQIVMSGKPKDIMNKTTERMKVFIETSRNITADFWKKVRNNVFDIDISEKCIYCETNNVMKFLILLLEYIEFIDAEITYLEIRHRNLEEIYLCEVKKYEND